MSTGRRRPRRRLVTVGSIALAASAATAVPAAAQEDGAPGGVVTVEPMLSADYRSGDHVLLRVSVAADRLIDGQIVVTPRAGDVQVRRRIEVAGGASKALLVLFPTADGMVDLEQVNVTLTDGTDEVATATTRLRSDGETDVAGVLPALLAQAPELPARVTLPGSQRRVNLAVVTPDVFAMGPAALDQLDSIVATSSDVAGLPPAARSVLFGWVNGGGRLLLDDADDLSVLPAPWRPDVAGYALAGGGEARLIDGAGRAGRWAELLDPAAATADQGFVGAPDFFVPPQTTLGQRAGVRLPDLNVLLIVLAIYVVVVGPIAYLLLRRVRRLTLAWVAIPALAVLTAAAVFVAGSGWRSSGRPTANIALELHPGGATALADVLLFNRGGGSTRLGLPAGWTMDEQLSTFFAAPESVARTVEVEDATTTIEATLEAGQLVVLNASGPASDSDLEVVAAADGAQSVSGTVTNTGTRVVRSTAVLARGAATLVGDLAPGQQRPFALVGVTGDGATSVADRVWSDAELGIGFAAATPGVDFGLWTSFSLRKGERLYPSGMVRVAGWVDDRPADLDAGGVLDARTLVTTLAPIGVTAAEAVPAMAVRSTIVQFAANPMTGARGEGIYRFLVPPAVATQPLEVELPSGLDDPRVWTPAGEWSELERREGSDAFTVPAEAVRAGAVLLQVDASEEFGFGLDPFATPILQGASDD